MAASSDAFKSFKSTGPVVFFDTKKDNFSALPQEVRKLRGEAHMGNTIPMVMVTTADLSVGLKGFSYADLGDAGKAARGLRRELKDKNVIGAEQTDPTATDEGGSSLLAEEQAWTNSDGVTITAAVLSMTEDTVIFLMPNGKSVGYPIEKLSASSREDLEGLE